MNHNQTNNEVFMLWLVRRIGWLGLIAMLGIGLLYPPLITDSAVQAKGQPQKTQKQEVRKTTGVNTNEIAKLLLGTLKGRVNVPKHYRSILAQYPVFLSVDDQSPQKMNLDGTYLFENLAPGAHKIVLAGRCWIDQHKAVTIRSQRTTTLNFNAHPGGPDCGG